MNRKAVVVNCDRCAVRLTHSAKRRNPRARLLRLARKDTTSGLCLNCAATAFFHQVPGLRKSVEEQGVDCLRFDHVQERFAKIMRKGHAQARPEDLDWSEIIANWHLPFPRGGRNR